MDEMGTAKSPVAVCRHCQIYHGCDQYLGCYGGAVSRRKRDDCGYRPIASR
jgi:hypothetical protein